MKESISIRPWKAAKVPKRILVIRIEALGDLFMIFPVISDFRKKFPDTKLDLLVRADYAELPLFIGLFDTVYPLKGIHTRRKLSHLPALIPPILKKKYDIVFDFQRNFYTRFLRKIIRPAAWIEFDRFSPASALKRTLWSINQAGLGEFSPDFTFAKKNLPEASCLELLRENGWNTTGKLILLNPAGLYNTRNWPLERYIEFCNYWRTYDPNVRFVVLGISSLSAKADYLQQHLADRMINLVGKTSVVQAYCIVNMVDFMLTEDSGLGHFSWLSGNKTLMLLGSTRSDWTSPYGTHTDSFNSNDLPCGNCMRSTCVHETILCMERLDSKTVFDRALKLFQK